MAMVRMKSTRSRASPARRDGQARHRQGARVASAGPRRPQDELTITLGQRVRARNGKRYPLQLSRAESSAPKPYSITDYRYYSYVLASMCAPVEVGSYYHWYAYAHLRMPAGERCLAL